MNAGPSKVAAKAVEQTDESYRRELLAAVWYTCSKIVEEEEVDLDVIATEAFVAALAEMVYAQIESMALDLEAFAKHAGRDCISTEDVLLACRKHPELQAKMAAMSGKAAGKK